MNERLWQFLAKCDAEGHLDLACQGLVNSVTTLTRRLGDKSKSLAEEFPQGAIAFRRAEQGFTLSRIELRHLAELEHYLEEAAPAEDPLSASIPSLQDLLRQVIPPLAATLPTSIGATASSRGEGSLFPKSQMLGIIVTAASFLAVIGLAALPAAITFGDLTWAVALAPLACAMLLGYVAWARWRQ